MAMVALTKVDAAGGEQAATTTRYVLWFFHKVIYNTQTEKDYAKVVNFSEVGFTSVQKKKGFDMMQNLLLLFSFISAKNQ
jgi:hypothetical protein